MILGKEKVLASLGGALKNGAIQGGYADLLNRYLLSEIWLSILSSEYIGVARDKGVPTAWQSLDFADITEFALIVLKGAKHANAAKLVSLYLASPEGSKFQLEEAKLGNLYYPGNYEHDIRLQNQKQGISEIFTTRKKDILEFYDSKEASQLGKDIAVLFQTGGGR